jgi:hypothetical protein
VSARVLARPDLNRALLARQLLLERGTGRLGATIERIGSLQTQYSPSGYVGLWTRLSGFERDALTRALERRRVVQATLMRVTIHMATVRDYRLFTAGIREPRRELWLRAHRGTPDRAAVERAAACVREALAEGPRRRAEVVNELGLDPPTWNGAALWLELVRVPPSGTWERRRADLFALPETWLGKTDEPGEAEGVEHLARRYLGAFGPARPAEIADWAGVPASHLAPALERLPLRRFRDEDGRELVDVRSAPLPDPETPAPVRFLPVWDAVLLAHARGTGILAEEDRPRVFSTKTPQSVSTFLVDGSVAGTWRYEDGRVVTEPFGRLPRAVARELADFPA